MTTYLPMLYHPIQLPYCITKLQLPGEVWLPLNRAYKPLHTPWHDRTWVDYLDFAEQAMRFSSSPLNWKGVWATEGRAEMLWLKDDGTPSSVYFERLDRMMAKRWESVEMMDIAVARIRLTSKAVREAIDAAGWWPVVEAGRALGCVVDPALGVRALAADAVHRKIDSKLRSALRKLRSDSQDAA